MSSSILAVIAFIMLKEECAPEEFDAKIKNPLKELVRTKIASFAIPSLFLVSCRYCKQWDGFICPPSFIS